MTRSNATPNTSDATTSSPFLSTRDRTRRTSTGPRDYALFESYARPRADDTDALAAIINLPPPTATAATAAREASRCPDPSNLWLINTETGEYHPKGCGQQSCPPCIRAKAHLTALAIELAEPKHHITLTLTGSGSWPERKTRMQQFNRRMRDRPGLQAWQCVWHVHADHRDDGQTHIHILARGTIDHELIQDTAISQGMGRQVDVRPIRGRGFGYGMHPVTETLTLPDHAAAQPIDDYLHLNGSRLFHATRGFWRDRHGRPSTVRDARRTASAGSAWIVQAKPPDAS